MWRTNLNVLIVALVVIGAYTAIAHVIPQLESEVPEALDLGSDVTPEALVEAGERVYNGAGGCTACHGLGTRAPNLLTDDGGTGTIGIRCATREPGKDCKTYLYEALVEPGAFVVSGFANIMPDMRRQLPMDQIWAVIAYLEAQGGEVTVTAADLGATSEAPAPTAGPAVTAGISDPTDLLTASGCVGCHQLNGAGSAVGPSFDGIGRRLSRDQLREGILNPGATIAQGYEQMAGVMPATFGQQLTAAQLEAMVSFLAEQR